MHYETDIYLAVEALGNHCLRAAAQIKREVKTFLAPRLYQETEYMALLVQSAAMARGADKGPIYNEILTSLEAVRFALKRAADTHYLPPSFYANAIPLTVSVGKQAVALRNHFAPPPQ